jgi:hypothetical protein
MENKIGNASQEAKALLGKGYSITQVKRILKRKGLSEDEVNQAVSQLPEYIKTNESAYQNFQKFHGKSEKPVERERDKYYDNSQYRIIGRVMVVLGLAIFLYNLMQQHNGINFWQSTGFGMLGSGAYLLYRVNVG